MIWNYLPCSKFPNDIYILFVLFVRFDEWLMNDKKRLKEKEETKRIYVKRTVLYFTIDLLTGR